MAVQQCAHTPTEFLPMMASAPAQDDTQDYKLKHMIHQAYSMLLTSDKKT